LAAAVADRVDDRVRADDGGVDDVLCSAQHASRDYHDWGRAMHPTGLVRARCARTDLATHTVRVARGRVHRAALEKDDAANERGGRLKRPGVGGRGADRG
jgi:hypothetical protein